MEINSPTKFVTQVRYQAREAEILLLVNSNMNASYDLTILPAKEIVEGKQAWLWKAESGQRYKLETNGPIKVDMEPADLKLLIFDKEKKGTVHKPTQRPGANAQHLINHWSVVGDHVNGTVIAKEMDELRDLKEFAEWVNFCGTIVYSNKFMIEDKSKPTWMSLGKVFGVSELSVNGKNLGATWWGRRIYRIADYIKAGNNTVEIKIITTMGNYLKSLTDNKIAQYWTNEGNKVQPVQSIGLLGPVIIY
jgi:hypothetical protein